MENILAMVEGPSTSEIKTFDQIDQNLFKDFLAKGSVWDFYEMSKEEYSNKDDIQKPSLIIKYYNEMAKCKSSLFHLQCLGFVSLIQFLIVCYHLYLYFHRLQGLLQCLIVQFLV